MIVGKSGVAYSLYEPLRVGGAGAFGQLWTGQYTAADGSHPTVAVKILDQRSLVRDDAARAEFERGRDRGPHVVRFRDHSADGADPAFVVMDYLPGVNLQRWVEDNGTHGDAELAALLSALASALEHIYGEHDSTRRSYHGDLSPKNLMRVPPTDEAPRPRYVVLDFGHGHRDQTLTPSSVVHPARYVTPEANRPISELGEHLIYSDVHLAAQVVLYALSGDHPTTWGSTDVGRDLAELGQRIPSSAPPALRDLLVRMLEVDIRTRARRARLSRVTRELRSIADDLLGTSGRSHRTAPDQPRSVARRVLPRAGRTLLGLASGLVVGLVAARWMTPRLEGWGIVPIGTEAPQEFAVALMLAWGGLFVLATGLWLIRRRTRKRVA
ncbi:protein kinase domain-containing protein [Nocardioides zhouii]|uniref:protein kinase domain-containing protein n=1 Tax=Nocardioides zhouii TaxID=1168729 RepID=UPI0013EBFB1E|nr:protein kinase [Nocardioides zhouii]